MSSLNHPDKITLDAFSDPQLQTQAGNGYYNRFTNVLRTPVLNAKSIQLMNANFINSVLQLNDASSLMFFYYTSVSPSSVRQLANLRCVRLLQSNYVPPAGYTAFTRNRYYNSVSELVSSLNVASAAGGDDVVYNPLFSSGAISFGYDTTTRKVSVASLISGQFVILAAADDPFVIDQLRGTTNPLRQLRMNGFNNFSGYTGATIQPFVPGFSMNSRLGFAMSINARGLYFGASVVYGCATSTGAPISLSSVEADAFPILLGSQNVSIYLSIITGSGVDNTGRKNLLCSIPIEVAPLAINSYTASAIELPAKSIPNEIYEISVEMLDDVGVPFLQAPNYNTELSLVFGY